MAGVLDQESSRLLLERHYWRHKRVVKCTWKCVYPEDYYQKSEVCFEITNDSLMMIIKLIDYQTFSMNFSHCYLNNLVFPNIKKCLRPQSVHLRNQQRRLMYP
jgi:hypothetical protein